MNFIEQVLEGDVLDTEIDDFIEQWHQGAGKMPLPDFLGFTRDEYALWVEQPEALRSILFCRKCDVDMSRLADWQDAHRLAARSQQAGDATELLRWLKETGRLE